MATTERPRSNKSTNSIGIPLNFSSSYNPKICSLVYLKGCGPGADPFCRSDAGKYEPSFGNPGDAGVCVAREYDMGGLGAAPDEDRARGELRVEDNAGNGTCVADEWFAVVEVG